LTSDIEIPGSKWIGQIKRAVGKRLKLLYLRQWLYAAPQSLLGLFYKTVKVLELATATPIQ
jgi:hypothetical protein